MLYHFILNHWIAILVTHLLLGVISLRMSNKIMQAKEGKEAHLPQKDAICCILGGIISFAIDAAAFLGFF